MNLEDESETLTTNINGNPETEEEKDFIETAKVCLAVEELRKELKADIECWNDIDFDFNKGVEKGLKIALKRIDKHLGFKPLDSKESKATRQHCDAD
jgi:hypothetical protein